MVSNSNDDDAAITIAALGGGALLARLLLRGGWGVGGGGSKGLASGASVPSSASPAPAGPPCRVRISGRAVTVNGELAALPVVVERCRVSGRAELLVIGDAVVGVADETVRALNRAGISLVTRGDFDISRALGRP